MAKCVFKTYYRKIEEKYLKNHFKSKDTKTFEIIAGPQEHLIRSTHYDIRVYK